MWLAIFNKPLMPAAYPKSAAAFIATHNRDSVERAVALMEDLNIPRNDQQYVYACLQRWPAWEPGFAI